MDREYDATVDSGGDIHLPMEIQERYGLREGKHVTIRERGEHLEIDPNPIEDITDLEGWMSPSNAVELLLRERALDKIREDEKIRIR